MCWSGLRTIHIRVNMQQTIYQIESEKMNDYISSVNRRKAFTLLPLVIIAVSFQGYISFKKNDGTPVWLFILITIIISAALFFGISLFNKKLRRLSNGQFIVETDSIKFQTNDDLARDFKLEEIAVITKKYSGTYLIKGNGLTKINYIRPKRSAYQLGDQNVIFIPTITSNYDDLIERIKENSKNAMKF